MEELTKQFGSGVNLDGMMTLATEYGVKIVGAILLIFLAFWLAAKLKKVVVAAMTRAHVDETLTKFSGNLARWIVLIAVGISILGVLGVQTASFAAVIAASGLAIGLAFQGTLANVASGVMLLIFRPFRVGHFIKVAGEAGVVNEITLFSTTLDTPDCRRIIIPNAAVFGATLENVSHHPLRRVDVAVGVAYDASIEGTRQVLGAAAQRVEGVVEDPAYAVVLTGLGASSVDWAVRVWAKNEDYWAVREALLGQVKVALDEAKIGIPFPQMDVHLPALHGAQLAIPGAGSQAGAPAAH